MKRIVLAFASAGVLIPIILLGAVQIELFIDMQKVPLTRSFWNYLWPSSIFLGATVGPGVSIQTKAIIWVIAVLVNMLEYALVGLIVALAWLYVSKKRAGGVSL